MNPGAPPLLEARGLTVRYTQHKSAFTALRSADLTLHHDETVGIVGESGCGKSTLAKALVGLVELASGAVRLDGIDVTGLDRKARRPFRQRIQMIFQDPHASLNPRLTVGKAIEAPLIVHRLATDAQRPARVAQLLRLVGLPESYAERYPHELSGGQRQRVGIARALAVNPKLLIADEAVSALDVSVQGQILNLLMRLKAEFGLSILFVSHDLAAVQHVSDRVVVMYMGRVVETGGRSRIWAEPLHPYTRTLIDASPIPDPASRGDRQAPADLGEVPSLLAPPSGCVFHPRCAHATVLCTTQEPPLRAMAERSVACHHAPIRWGKAIPFAKA